MRVEAIYGESCDPALAVIFTSDHRELRRVRTPGVQAVIYTSATVPGWLPEVEARVAEGRFVIVPRMILHGVSRAEIVDRIEADLPWSELPSATAAALKADILGLVDAGRDLTGSERLRFRLLTDLPDCECSYHVDTVPAGVHPVGTLRVYCGASTQYVEPDAVSDLADFYAYVFRRDRLMHRLEEAERRGDHEGGRRLREERRRMDDPPAFVRRADGIRTVPAGSIVAFKNADAGRLWGSDHLRFPREAWIHRSPMEGGRRLVVSVNAV